jgi:hypothetical protein
MLIGCALSVISATLGVAQSSPHDAIALVHGRGQNGGAWVTAAPQLQALFGVPVLAPSLGTGASWSSQSSALHAALAGRSSAFAVSHSNGGPVTRHYLRTFGSATRVNAHFSMGSPHLGAPIAESALNGDVSLWLGGTAAQLVSTVNYYLANDPELNGQLHPTVALLVDMVLSGAAVMSAGLASLGYYYANSEPVLHDLSPSSTNVAALADPSFASAEASAFSTRVSLVTELSNSLQPYSLVLTPSSAQDVKTAVLLLSNIAWDTYEYYSQHANPWLQAYAGNWAIVAYDLAELQLTWQLLIGAAIVGKGGTLIFTQSDGLIPWNRSFYAGAEQLTLPRSAYGDIPHVMQQHHPDVLGFASAALAGAGIPAYVPPNPPPPPPFSMFINGTVLARPGNTCNYFGGSADAATPYALTWSLDGVVISADPSVDITFVSSGVYELTLAILDADGEAWMQHLSVQVSNENSDCIAQ